MTVNDYEINKWIFCIDSYKYPSEDQRPYEWLPCRRCNLKPKIWVFNNEESTVCGCAKNIYDHFSIQAPAILKCKSVEDYKSDQLRINWNHYCVTGEILYDVKTRKQKKTNHG